MLCHWSGHGTMLGGSRKTECFHLFHLTSHGIRPPRRPHTLPLPKSHATHGCCASLPQSSWLECTSQKFRVPYLRSSHSIPLTNWEICVFRSPAGADSAVPAGVTSPIHPTQSSGWCTGQNPASVILTACSQGLLSLKSQLNLKQYWSLF